MIGAVWGVRNQGQAVLQFAHHRYVRGRHTVPYHAIPYRRYVRGQHTTPYHAYHTWSISYYRRYVRGPSITRAPSSRFAHPDDQFFHVTRCKKRDGPGSGVRKCSEILNFLSSQSRKQVDDGRGEKTLLNFQLFGNF